MDFTNCDSFFITKCDTVYYKLRQVLQSAMIITNCDSTPGGNWRGSYSWGYKEYNAITMHTLFRVCLHGGGGSRVGEVTLLGGVTACPYDLSF